MPQTAPHAQHKITKLSKFTKKITKNDSLVIFLVSFVVFVNFPVRRRD